MYLKLKRVRFRITETYPINFPRLYINVLQVKIVNQAILTIYHRELFDSIIKLSWFDSNMIYVLSLQIFFNYTFSPEI